MTSPHPVPPGQNPLIPSVERRPLAGLAGTGDVGHDGDLVATCRNGLTAPGGIPLDDRLLSYRCCAVTTEATRPRDAADKHVCLPQPTQMPV